MTELLPSLVERIARDCCDATTDHRGRVTYEFDGYGLTRFAALLAAEAARLCEELDSPVHGEAVRRVARDRADAIRSRFGLESK